MRRSPELGQALLQSAGHSGIGWRKPSAIPERDRDPQCLRKMAGRGLGLHVSHPHAGDDQIPLPFGVPRILGCEGFGDGEILAVGRERAGPVPLVPEPSRLSATD